MLQVEQVKKEGIKPMVENNPRESAIEQVNADFHFWVAIFTACVLTVAAIQYCF